MAKFPNALTVQDWKALEELVAQDADLQQQLLAISTGSHSAASSATPTSCTAGQHPFQFQPEHEQIQPAMQCRTAHIIPASLPRRVRHTDHSSSLGQFQQRQHHQQPFKTTAAAAAAAETVQAYDVQYAGYSAFTSQHLAAQQQYAYPQLPSAGNVGSITQQAPSTSSLSKHTASECLPQQQATNTITAHQQQELYEQQQQQQSWELQQAVWQQFEDQMQNQAYQLLMQNCNAPLTNAAVWHQPATNAAVAATAAPAAAMGTGSSASCKDTAAPAAAVAAFAQAVATLAAPSQLCCDLSSRQQQQQLQDADHAQLPLSSLASVLPGIPSILLSPTGNEYRHQQQQQHSYNKMPTDQLQQHHQQQQQGDILPLLPPSPGSEYMSGLLASLHKQLQSPAGQQQQHRTSSNVASKPADDFQSPVAPCQSQQCFIDMTADSPGYVQGQYGIRSTPVQDGSQRGFNDVIGTDPFDDGIALYNSKEEDADPTAPSMQLMGLTQQHFNGSGPGVLCSPVFASQPSQSQHELLDSQLLQQAFEGMAATADDDKVLKQMQDEWAQQFDQDCFAQMAGRGPELHRQQQQHLQPIVTAQQQQQLHYEEYNALEYLAKEWHQQFGVEKAGPQGLHATEDAMHSSGAAAVAAAADTPAATAVCNAADMHQPQQQTAKQGTNSRPPGQQHGIVQAHQLQPPDQVQQMKAFNSLVCPPALQGLGDDSASEGEEASASHAPLQQQQQPMPSKLQANAKAAAAASQSAAAAAAAVPANVRGELLRTLFEGLQNGISTGSKGATHMLDLSGPVMHSAASAQPKRAACQEHVLKHNTASTLLNSAATASHPVAQHLQQQQLQPGNAAVASGSNSQSGCRKRSVFLDLSTPVIAGQPVAAAAAGATAGLEQRSAKASPSDLQGTAAGMPSANRYTCSSSSELTGAVALLTKQRKAKRSARRPRADLPGLLSSVAAHSALVNHKLGLPGPVAATAAVDDNVSADVAAVAAGGSQYQLKAACTFTAAVNASAAVAAMAIPASSPATAVQHKPHAINRQLSTTHTISGRVQTTPHTVATESAVGTTAAVQQQLQQQQHKAVQELSSLGSAAPDEPVHAPSKALVSGSQPFGTSGTPAGPCTEPVAAVPADKEAEEPATAAAKLAAAVQGVVLPAATPEAQQTATTCGTTSALGATAVLNGHISCQHAEHNAGAAAAAASGSAAPDWVAYEKPHKPEQQLRKQDRQMSKSLAAGSGMHALVSKSATGALPPMGQQQQHDPMQNSQAGLVAAVPTASDACIGVSGLATAGTTGRTSSGRPVDEAKQKHMQEPTSVAAPIAIESGAASRAPASGAAGSNSFTSTKPQPQPHGTTAALLGSSRAATNKSHGQTTADGVSHKQQQQQLVGPCEAAGQESAASVPAAVTSGTTTAAAPTAPLPAPAGPNWLEVGSTVATDGKPDVSTAAEKVSRTGKKQAAAVAAAPGNCTLPEKQAPTASSIAAALAAIAALPAATEDQKQSGPVVAKDHTADAHTKVTTLPMMPGQRGQKLAAADGHTADAVAAVWRMPSQYKAAARKAAAAGEAEAMPKAAIGSQATAAIGQLSSQQKTELPKPAARLPTKQEQLAAGDSTTLADAFRQLAAAAISHQQQMSSFNQLQEPQCDEDQPYVDAAVGAAAAAAAKVPGLRPAAAAHQGMDSNLHSMPLVPEAAAATVGCYEVAAAATRKGKAAAKAAAAAAAAELHDDEIEPAAATLMRIALGLRPLKENTAGKRSSSSASAYGGGGRSTAARLMPSHNSAAAPANKHGSTAPAMVGGDAAVAAAVTIAQKALLDFHGRNRKAHVTAAAAGTTAGSSSNSGHPLAGKADAAETKCQVLQESNGRIRKPSAKAAAAAAAAAAHRSHAGTVRGCLLPAPITAATVVSSKKRSKASTAAASGSNAGIVMETLLPAVPATAAANIRKRSKAAANVMTKAQLITPAATTSIDCEVARAQQQQLPQVIAHHQQQQCQDDDDADDLMQHVKRSRRSAPAALGVAPSVRQVNKITAKRPLTATKQRSATAANAAGVTAAAPAKAGVAKVNAPTADPQTQAVAVTAAAVAVLSAQGGVMAQTAGSDATENGCAQPPAAKPARPSQASKRRLNEPSITALKPSTAQKQKQQMHAAAVTPAARKRQRSAPGQAQQGKQQSSSNESFSKGSADKTIADKQMRSTASADQSDAPQAEAAKPQVNKRGSTVAAAAVPVTTAYTGRRAAAAAIAKTTALIKDEPESDSAESSDNELAGDATDSEGSGSDWQEVKEEDLEEHNAGAATTTTAGRAAKRSKSRSEGASAGSSRGRAEANRLSAARSYARRKEALVRLDASTTQLQETNSALQQQVQALQEQLQAQQQLQSALHEHRQHGQPFPQELLDAVKST